LYKNALKFTIIDIDSFMISKYCVEVQEARKVLTRQNTAAQRTLISSESIFVESTIHPKKKYSPNLTLDESKTQNRKQKQFFSQPAETSSDFSSSHRMSSPTEPSLPPRKRQLDAEESEITETPEPAAKRKAGSADEASPEVNPTHTRI
jgi:hypothetical protein